MRGIHNRGMLLAALSLALSSPIYGGQEVQRTPDPTPPKPQPPYEPVAPSHADPGSRFVPLDQRNFSRKKRKLLRARGKL